MSAAGNTSETEEPTRVAGATWLVPWEPAHWECGPGLGAVDIAALKLSSDIGDRPPGDTKVRPT